MISKTPSIKRIFYSFIQLLSKVSVIFCLVITLVNAQSIDWIIPIGGEGNDGIDVMTLDNNKQVIVSGTYMNATTGLVQDLPTYGGADIFLAKLNPEGDLSWIKGMGSSNDDEIIDIQTDEANNIYVLGNYWIEAVFDSLTLIPTNGTRAIFLTKYNQDGQVLWAKNISSSGAKSASGMSFDSNQDLLLTGYFSDTLFIENETRLAKADIDLFLCKLDTDGQLMWLSQAGVEGDNKPKALAVAPDNSIAISGVMLGTLAIAQDTFQTQTNDLDVFVAKFDEAGNALWGRKAGGVFRDNNTGIAVDELGDIYLTGDFRGVMKLSETLTIVTDGILDENFYITKYDTAGIPLWGRSLGSSASEFSQHIKVDKGRISLIGYFLGTMLIDGLEARAEDAFDTFLAEFDAVSGQIIWIEVLQGNDNILGHIIAPIEEGFIVAGSFREQLFFNDEILESSGAYDGFVSFLNKSITSIPTLPSDIKIEVFPNPTSGLLNVITNLQKYEVKIFDTYGKLQLLVNDETALDLRHLPQGIYFVQFITEEKKIQTKKIIISSF